VNGPFQSGQTIVKSVYFRHWVVACIGTSRFKRLLTDQIHVLLLVTLNDNTAPARLLVKTLRDVIMPGPKEH